MRLPLLLALTASVPAAATGTTYTDCDTMWALAYATQNGLTSCSDAVIDCDKTNDPSDTALDELCSANELLEEFYDDPLHGELVDTDGDDIPDTFPGDFAPNGDANLQTFMVPKCENGGSSCPGAELRCVDGTRPLYWLDPADDLTSNKWIVTFQGGANCGPRDGDSAGQNCWEAYSSGAMDAKSRKQMSSTFLDGGVPQPLSRTTSIGGILQDASDHSFKDYHRIKVTKCGFDKNLGTMTLSDVAGAHSQPDPIDGRPENDSGSTFELHFHGWRIVKAVLNDLENGKTYDRFPTGPVASTPVSTTLPAMEDATEIVLAGHSGGAQGLAHRLDLMNDFVQHWDDIEVRGLYDALTKPRVEQLYFQSEGVSGTNVYDYNSGPADCDSLTQNCLPAHGTVAEASYGPGYYEPSTDGTDGGELGNMHYTWGAVQDASCVADHIGVEEWRCNDPAHVAFNHTETPFFLRMAQLDDNSSNKAPEGALDPYDSFDDTHFRTLVNRAPLHFLQERNQPWAARNWHERVYGWARDPSVHSSATGLGVFHPDEITHGGLFNTAQFRNVALEDTVTGDCVTYATALKRWLDGNEEFWVEGVYDVDTVSSCP